MINTIDVTGKTEEEAIASALAQLGLERDDVSIEIKQRSKSGFLGIGSAPAIVAVTYELPDAPADPEPAPPVREEKPARPAKGARNEKKARNDKPAPATAAPAAAPVVTAPISRKGTQEERTRAFLTGLLAQMGVSANIDISPRESGGLDVALSGENMGAIIGRRGETLDAIQHLTNYSVNRGSEKRMHINVDAENYRSKREESLVRLAEKMAAKAIKYRRSMALEPMNSYERHIIHTALQDYKGVTTSSTGTEPNRRVVVSYVRSGDERQNRSEPSSAPAAKTAPAAEKTEAPVQQPVTTAAPKENKHQVKEWA